MNGAYYVGAVGLDAQQKALEVIANNIANMNTPGFKRTQAQFSELVASRLDIEAARASVSGASSTLSGVKLVARPMLSDQGELEETGRAMDIAIDGTGFIEIMGADGQTLLWRGGGLKVTDSGLLATADGFALRDAITVPQGATSISIAQDGTVTASTSDQGSTQLGRISLVLLKDDSGVERLDGGLYRVVDTGVIDAARPGEDGAGLVHQGAIERSNVAMTDEMVQLMLVQRAYAANAQVVQAADQLTALANNLRK